MRRTRWTLTAEQRLRQKVSITRGGCWAWTGTHYRRGYGAFWHNGKLRRAHRVSYEIFVGEIPTGFSVHHKCGNTECVNPEHLEAIPQAEHTWRHPQTPMIQNAFKTYCVNGHEFTPENTYNQKPRSGRVYRGCRKCRAASHLRDQQKKRSAIPSDDAKAGRAMEENL